ncbi:HAD-IIB family hydrolase [Shewanella electrodiphila]|uniref:HAD-IIB family hydrolase n=1 Tax=Shewanella electrodiphila TaxID=934143 RepID=A0ABT0KTY0_9GAMM|nr:HAD-IIB family hydrolase [Shewanella electrodiphila]MCL1047311.1 HAD-IIB family hydrolase [Shewanella electrodiphila]
MTTRPLIFTDMDGTLLDHYDYSFSSAIGVIEALVEKQIPIIANTSKTFAEMEKIQQTIGFNSPFISENGAVVYIPIGYFDTQPADTITQGYYWVKEFCEPREHWLQLLDSKASDFASDYIGFSTLTAEELCEFTDLSAEKATLALVRHYSEPVLWTADESRKRAFIEHMNSLGANMLQGGRFLHVGGHTDKGRAMDWLAQVYADKYQTSVQTIALGDSGNDSAMLEAADVAIQIKSPTHTFPKIITDNKTMQSKHYGPKGWAECLQALLLESSTSTPSFTLEEA